jgi:hypothetical protein
MTDDRFATDDVHDVRLCGDRDVAAFVYQERA